MPYTVRTFRSSPEWQRLVKYVKATHAPICALPHCLHPTSRHIDVNADGRSDWGPNVCHILDAYDDPTGAHWYDPANVVLGHRRCNVDEGLRRRKTRRQDAIRAQWARREVNAGGRGGANHGQNAQTK